MALKKVYRSSTKVVTPPQMTLGDRELTFKLFAGSPDVNELSMALRGLVWIGMNTFPNQSSMSGTKIDDLYKIVYNS